MPHSIPSPAPSIQKTHATPYMPKDTTHTNGDVATPNNQVTDMYLLDDLGRPIIAYTSNPFLTVPSLHGPNGEHACFLAVVDNRAMINAIDTAGFQRIAHRLHLLSPFSQKLQMPNGLVISSTGTWAGKFEWGPLTTYASFEVFPSEGSWRMLIGKPLLEQIKATHNYSTDSISFPTSNGHHHIHNFTPHHILPYPSLPTAISLPVHTHFSSPSQTTDTNERTDIHLICTTSGTMTNTPINTPGDVSLPPPPSPNDRIFTRLTDKGPFHPSHIEAILNAIQIGNISPDETTRVHNLLCEFADVFALSVKEVKSMSSMKYHLKIPEGATFSVKVNQ